VELQQQSCNSKAVAALGSRSEGRGFEPLSMLDESGIKAMPGKL